MLALFPGLSGNGNGKFDGLGKETNSITAELHKELHMYTCTCTRNTHAQWASHQVYASPTRSAARACQLMTLLIVMDTYMYMYICTYIMRIDPSFRASC